MHQADSLIRGAGPLERQQIAGIAASVGQVPSPQMFFYGDGCWITRVVS